MSSWFISLEWTALVNGVRWEDKPTSISAGHQLVLFLVISGHCKPHLKDVTWWIKQFWSDEFSHYWEKNGKHMKNLNISQINSIQGYSWCNDWSYGHFSLYNLPILRLWAYGEAGAALEHWLLLSALICMESFHHQGWLVFQICVCLQLPFLICPLIYTMCRVKK